MTSYLRYQKEIRTVQDADDIESWITVRGNHIPIKKGQSKEEAVKSFLKNKGGSSSKTERKLSNGGKTIGLTQKEHNKIEKHNEKVGKIAAQYKAEGKKASEFIQKLEKKDPAAVKKFVESVEKGFGKNSPEAQKAREKYGIKPESSKKWSGAWSKRANKPETLGNSAKNATSISKMTKMSASERDEEVGFPMLEIAYNDVDFSADPAKNRSALSKAIKESGHENADLMKTVLANLSDNELKDADAVRKGIRDYMKSYKKSNKTVFYKNISGKELWSPAWKGSGRKSGYTAIENELLTEKEMEKHGFNKESSAFKKIELSKKDHHYMFGARFETKKNENKTESKESSKKWSNAWKEQAKEDLAWFGKGKTAKQRQEAGYTALEIAYNMEFGKNAAKNRSNLIKEVHNSGVEDPDYIEAILNNMEEKHFESQESFRKGLKNAKKKIEPSNKNLKED